MRDDESAENRIKDIPNTDPDTVMPVRLVKFREVRAEVENWVKFEGVWQELN
jgi:hypothetical protein